MFFWGCDAAHPVGNLFVRRGFERVESTGLRGTHLYRLPWENGMVELHGSHAAFYPAAGDATPGFLFIRPAARCFLWLGDDPAVPGKWPRPHLRRAPAATLHHSAAPLLRWWLDHESFIRRFAGPDYRIACRRRFARLPKSRPWLPPASAENWIRHFLADPAATPRARR